jgi:hypothetical protein
MAMIQTHTADRVYVSAVHAKNVIRLRIGPSELGEARIAELKPSEARTIALFLLQSADKVEGQVEDRKL